MSWLSDFQSFFVLVYGPLVAFALAVLIAVSIILMLYQVITGAISQRNTRKQD
jgi:hypothetical protein